MRSKSIFSWLVFLAVISAVFLGFQNFQEISDWVRLRNYHPSERVARLADDTTMKSSTRRVFYVNHPELDDKQEFNGHCRTTEQTIVLGCFIERKGIYLLDVKDSRLDGVVEVTAAHETLHAMYDRLSSKEREKVDKMTADFYSHIDNERIKKTVESYRSKDPSVVPNELHSILGTEVRDLSPQLEDYYKRYFSDRSKIVDYSDKYEESFLSIESKAKEYDARLSQLKEQITANETSINSQITALEEKQRELNMLLAADKREEYNQQVPEYNKMVDDYNSLVSTTKGLIDEYNLLLRERNQLVIQQQELYKAIDSNSINKRNSM